MVERYIMTPLLACKSPSCHEYFTSESPFVNWSPNWLSDPMATIQIERSSTFIWNKKCYFVVGDICGGMLVAITTLLPFIIRIPMAWYYNPLCLPHSSGTYPSVLLLRSACFVDDKIFIIWRISVSGSCPSFIANPLLVADLMLENEIIDDWFLFYDGKLEGRRMLSWCWCCFCLQTADEPMENDGLMCAKKMRKSTWCNRKARKFFSCK